MSFDGGFHPIVANNAPCEGSRHPGRPDGPPEDRPVTRRGGGVSRVRARQRPVADVRHVLEVLDDVASMSDQLLLAPALQVGGAGRGPAALLIASITRWKRETSLRTTMSKGVVVVPCSMKPRTWNRSASGRPCTS